MKNSVLVPIDGSENSLRVAQRLVDRVDAYGGANLEVHLLNVQHPFSANVSAFISQDQIRKAHQDEGVKALAAAREVLDKSGLKYETHIVVGDAPEVIAQYAREKACSQILMGTRGLGRVAGLLLRSVAQKVIQLTDIPVSLIK